MLHLLAQTDAAAVPRVTVIVPVLEGVTTAIVAFIFACVVWPHLVKNKTQFYAAFACVIGIILLHSLNIMIGSVGFQVFSGALTGLLQLGAVVLLFNAAGGISLREIGQGMGRAYEVIRRGEEEKTVIVPLTGEMPKPRQQPGGAAGGATAARDVDDDIDEDKIDLPPGTGWPAKPTGGRAAPAPPGAAAAGDASSIPLE